MSQSSLEPGPSNSGRWLIPGIYNYCDRWCERCALSARCRVFQHNRVLESAMADGLSLEHAMEKAESAVDLMAEPPPVLTPSMERERDRWIDLANREPTKDEIDRWQAIEDRRRAWVEAQSLTRLSQDYLHDALDLVTALEKRNDDDPAIVLALQTIHHHAFLIPSKIHRAMRGWWDVVDPIAADADDEDQEFARQDANGSAHVAWRAIVESRGAWEAVAACARVPSYGVALAMAGRSKELEEMVLALFPNAPAFKRPGFD